MTSRPESRSRRQVVSTYRLQLNREFGFRQAAKLVPYLDRLGITHLYASPIFAAAPGSSHGYDVIDPTRLNPELGSSEDFEALVDRLHQHGMGLVIDIVPNHQATHELNPAWMSVLERGRESPYSSMFDIDWARGDGKVIVPVLGRPLAEALNAGEIRLGQENDIPVLCYFDHYFPLSPESRERFAGRLGGGEVDQHLLAQLHDMQHYRLIHWRQAAHQINYRRFFDINDLIGVRVEDRRVFEATHRLIFSLAASGAIDGLRIDHVDGLADPTTYLQRLDEKLRELTGSSRCYIVVEKILGRDEELRRDWPVDGTTGYDFLRAANDVFVDADGLGQLEGDYASRCGQPDFDTATHTAKRQIIDSLFAGDLDALARQMQQTAKGWINFAGVSVTDVREALLETTCQLDVYRTYSRDGVMPPDDRRRIDRAVAAAQDQLDLDPQALALIRRVLTFDPPGDGDDGSRDECQRAVTRWQQLSGAVMAKSVEDTAFYRYCPLLSLNDVGSDPNIPADPVVAFHGWNSWAAEHWPTTMTATSTHDTKRGEDARARLDLLSEMPDAWNEAIGRWQGLNQQFNQHVDGERAPSRHDELFIYQMLLAVWPADSLPADEMRERLHTYLTKAIREEKRRTSWLQPNEPYERATHHFLSAILDSTHKQDFIADFGRFAGRIFYAGVVNGLAQLLLKLTSVGVPDTYRGTESWDLSLADPDNRRPVNFTALESRLQSVESIGDLPDATGEVRRLLENWEDGRIKLYLLNRVLSFRREHPNLFLEGDYLPLSATGERADQVIAFARCRGSDWSLTVAPRLLLKSSNQTDALDGPIRWLDTALVLPDDAPLAWRNLLTGATTQATQREGTQVLMLEAVLRDLPFALLTSGTKGNGAAQVR